MSELLATNPRGTTTASSRPTSGTSTSSTPSSSTSASNTPATNPAVFGTSPFGLGSSQNPFSFSKSNGHSQPSLFASLNKTSLTKTTVVDSNGDLHLEVGPHKHRFLVCSRTLARTSSVFSRMLFGPFMESKGSTETSVGKKDWTVQLPEDDVEALRVILHMVHSKFSLVPQFPTLDQLFDITVLTDKYDMTSVLRPWAHGWVLHLKTAVGRDDMLHETLLPQRGFVLWISWELGLVDLYKTTIRKIVNNCMTELKSPSLFRWGFPTPKEEEYVSSLGIIGQVKAFHEKQVKQFMLTIDTHLLLVQTSCVQGKRLQGCTCSPSSSLQRPAGPRGDYCDKICPTFAYGALLTCLGKIGVYPTNAGLSILNRHHCHPSLLSMQRMAAELGRFYASLKAEPHGQSGVLLQCRCQSCDPTVQLKEALEAIWRDIPDFVTEQEDMRMRKQREKIGLTGPLDLSRHSFVLPV